MLNSFRKEEVRILYLGRVVGAGRTSDGHNFLMYRLASRKFPHRRIETVGFSSYVESKPGFVQENSENENLIYPCKSEGRDRVVIGNGYHVNDIQRALAGGQEPLQAVTMGLGRNGVEKDKEKTPRLAAVMDHKSCWLGMIGETVARVERLTLSAGSWYTISTEKREWPQESIEDWLAGKEIHEIVAGESDSSTIATLVVVSVKDEFVVDVKHF